MLFASIDIGSNAARLLLANVFDSTQEPSTASHVAFIRVPLRLGEDVFHDGMISEPRVANLMKTLKAYKLLMDVYEPIDFDICATAAMREASNRDDIIQRMKKETGLTIHVIDGMEEATIIRESNNLFSKFRDETLMYVDVGGGSTEISILHDNNFVTSRSFNVGTIRMLQEKIEDEHWNEMLRWVEESTKPFSNIACIGSGGNINKLVKLYGNKATSRITLKELNEGYHKLSRMSVRERMEKLQMRPDRADVIVPAAKIFSCIMSAAGIESVLAPKLGLVDGLIYELSQKHHAATHPDGIQKE
jgi:exopolyphosphatase/guanosine-5'-triphosphate,3'-diphosphate pyrophosphatase